MDSDISASAANMSMSRGKRLGLAGRAFLFGIFLHSLAPYEPIFSAELPWAVAGLALILFIPTIRSNEKMFTALLLIAACLAGIWRFDAARSSLPFDLKPFDPEGFAWSLPANYPPQDPRYFLVEQRERITSHINQALPGDQGALLAGMLYGERALSDHAKELFRDAGMLHLIAVSGSNVTILVVIVMRMLLGLGISRRPAFIGMTLSLLAFVFFVGPQASVVRAAIMGWLIEFAPLMGRIPKPSRLVLVSAVIFSCIQPWVLLYDAGFALSFLATIGLLTFGLWLNERMRRWPIIDTVREIFTATVAATLLTLPYSAWAFGHVSLIGLLTNMLAVPLVPWVMGTGILVMFAPAGSVFHLPAKGFLELVLQIARIPELLPIGIWNHVSTGYVFMIGSYLFLFVIWRSIKRKRMEVRENIHNKHFFLS